MRKAQVAGLGLLVAALSFCRPSVLSISPLPAHIEMIEGHASLIISADQETSRSKFSFVFHLPSQGRIEVTGALGSVLYRILIDGGEAYLVVPSKKVYWQSREEEIIFEFLGFRLSLAEMIHLFSGDWERKEQGFEQGLEGWNLVRDSKKRVKSGQRGDLWFEVEEFIDDTPFARRIAFEHSLSSGQLKVLSIGLNRPIKEGVFSKKFLEKYQPRTWAEIQDMIRNAR
jgi:hypothetical protein